MQSEKIIQYAAEMVPGDERKHQIQGKNFNDFQLFVNDGGLTNNSKTAVLGQSSPQIKQNTPFTKQWVQQLICRHLFQLLRDCTLMAAVKLHVLISLAKTSRPN